MDTLSLTINLTEIKEKIMEEGINVGLKAILTMILNSIMETERDNFIEASPYERNDQRKDYRNGNYERSYTTKLEVSRLKYPERDRVSLTLASSKSMNGWINLWF